MDKDSHLPEAIDWEQYRRRFRHKTGSAADADELCQVFFFKVHDAAPYLRRATHPRSYVNTIWYNVLRDWGRTRNRSLARLFADESEIEDKEADEPGPDQVVARGLWLIAFHRTFARLPLEPCDRMILDRLDDPVAEVAKTLGIREPALRQRRSRLMKRLREQPELRQLYQEAPWW